ncbi:MAG: CDP-paratose 2-epimerase [Chloroflexi bacterium HGW-Chloroflexi-8]|nr:MAG: CDP-paratose 2-epimerase [Chloroflexi bacterium HGW-Chloroflexi-8]
MSRNYLITGGAGFIGSNYCHRLLSRGENVRIFDNLSREGTEKNLEWLYAEFGNKSFDFVQADIRDQNQIQVSAQDADVIVHLAGQVAVTTSVVNPRDDFEVNALGTFNVLEAARLSGKQPVFIYASTNKVYGGMDDLVVLEGKSQYTYQDFPFGISEARLLDFHSPYGCSKGSGDQYVRDYARIYGLPSVVLRQSCIYGPRQFGIEDQGWVAWFIIASIMGKPISIFGNGKQVRDLLYIEDLLDVYDLVISKNEESRGKVFNIGGGIENTMSVWADFGPILSDILDKPLSVNFKDWRPGDQKIYVSDIRKAEKILGWNPKTSVKLGIQKLTKWVEENQHLFLR